MNVREKEAQAESIARILDDAISLPGMRSRFGIDLLVGLLPVVGDAFITIWRRVNLGHGAAAASITFASFLVFAAMPMLLNRSEE